MRVLVVNAGSSSLKVDIVDDGDTVESHDGLPALAPRVDAVGHRIVHGGPDLVEPVVIDADVERPSVWIGWALPPQNTEDGEMAQFGLNRLIGQISQAGNEYGFAYNVDATVLGGQLAPLFLINHWVSTDPLPRPRPTPPRSARCTRHTSNGSIDTSSSVSPRRTRPRT